MKKILYILLFLTSFQINASTNWMDSLEEAKKLSLLLNKPILVDFWATWCGPCRTMNSDVWSDKKVQELMKYYIPVKIDIEVNQHLARKYSVRSIPNILILDSWGNILYKSSGYEKKGSIKKLLLSFAVNMTTINSAMTIWEKSKKNSFSNLRVAQKYQEIAPFLKREAKHSFIKQSNRYLKKALKYLKKNNTEKEQKITLLKLLNKAYYGNVKSALKKTLKKQEEIKPENLSLYYFILFYCYHKEEKKEDVNRVLEKLKKSEENDIYLKKIQLFLKLKQK